MQEQVSFIQRWVIFKSLDWRKKIIIREGGVKLKFGPICESQINKKLALLDQFILGSVLQRRAKSHIMLLIKNLTASLA